jgi:integrase
MKRRMKMGSIFKRKGKQGITWYVSYYVDGTQHKERVGRQKDGITGRMAKEALRSREGAITQGKFDIAQSKSSPRFDRLMAEYLGWSKAHKKSHRRDEVSSKHLKPSFGNKRINDITPWLIEKYKIKRKEEITARYPEKLERDISFVSINRELALLKHFYTMAIKWGNIDSNPVKGIKMFPEKKRERYLDREEITSLLKACKQSDNKNLYMIVFCALNLGTRLQETLKLRVGDLDFGSSIVNLEHTKNGDRGKVPMSDILGVSLKEHVGDRTEGYLFCGKNGKPYDSIRTSFTKALKVASIEDFTFHCLRHTWASHLTMNGVDSLVLQDLGRWKSPIMVQRYAHMSPRYRKSAVDTLGCLFANSTDLNNSGEEATISVAKIG